MMHVDPQKCASQYVPQKPKKHWFQRVLSGKTHSVRESTGERLRNHVEHLARAYPARMVVAIFVLLTLTLTLLLSLPFSVADGTPTPFVDTLFTAVSSICITGLETVNTATHWSTFGQAIIALGAAVGGLGVMTLASILGVAISHHLGLTQRMLTALETQSPGIGKVTALLKGVVVTSLTAEGVLFLSFFPHYLHETHSWLKAAWHSTFMAISVFNNAGFIITPAGIAPYTSNWGFILPVALGTIVGAIGFPVITDIAARWRTPKRWTLHTKLTLSTYFILMILGIVILGATEWSNIRTLGSLDTPGRILNSLLLGVNSRSSGLSVLDVGEMRAETHFVQDILMMIGGGSASTAGGIKVTTFAVLALSIVAEARGNQDVQAFRRRIPPSVVRLSVVVALTSVVLVAVSVFVLLSVTNYSLDKILFECISAFATVGLSTGITPTLPTVAKYVLAALMFSGRLGTMTVAAALAMRHRRGIIRLPEESPIVG